MQWNTMGKLSDSGYCWYAPVQLSNKGTKDEVCYNVKFLVFRISKGLLLNERWSKLLLVLLLCVSQLPAKVFHTYSGKSVSC